MKLFECQNCGHLVFFENTRCERCGFQLGYLPAAQTISALEECDGGFRALAAPDGQYLYCANAAHDVCNWLVPADQPEQVCLACRHNRMIPDLSAPDNLRLWRKIEDAKHRLFYTLIQLKLPLATKLEDPDALAFDFIADEQGPNGHIPVLTGHENGLITINIAEADDPERERRRAAMGEPYRTLLGHFRHEIAHYYWDRLVAQTATIDTFRTVFGDEQRDYGAALNDYYANGPQPNWSDNFVTAYASSHPWEDFAETWAHYFHMIDTLETASAFGVSMKPKAPVAATLAARIDFDPHTVSMERIAESWIAFTCAMNAINRSMGLQDLYPFVLSPAVNEKLAFIHRLVHDKDAAPADSSVRETLRGISAKLRESIRRRA